ncbi:MAG: hypothetical protein ABJF11_05655 [Reichenbachiella sp.]|uniref:hypothetical protein n=1 Tax=Reichenbachiella sp. TaxID=2184521 RepID=UPI00326405B5
MKKIAFTFLLSALITKSFAQEQWLITTKQDTLRGKIYLEYGGPYKADVARVKVGKEKSSYLAYQVLVVFLGENNQFETIKLDQRFQFVKVDVKGKYFSQYLYKDPAAGSNSNYAMKLLVNWKGEQYKVSNMTSKKRFMEFFEECEEVVTRLESGELKKKDLANIFNIYDSCIDNQNAILPEQPTKKAEKKVRKTTGMSDFVEELKAKDLLNDDLTSMLNDVNLKLSDGQTIPQYLQQAVLTQLGENGELKTKFLKLLEQ